MNERIRELADEAWQYANNNSHDGDETHGWLYRDKFAELVVRECALVAKTLPHTPERDWILDSVTHIPVHCEQNILKHFGVEP